MVCDPGLRPTRLASKGDRDPHHTTLSIRVRGSTQSMIVLRQQKKNDNGATDLLWG